MSDQNSTAPKTTANPAPADTAPRQGETVKLSSAAQTLRNVQSTLADTPDVDQERVERLKAEIESGSYRVNAGRVAEGMMRVDDLLS